MAQVPAQSFYLGPFAVYTSPTGMQSPITGIPYLGGTLHEGDYVDLTHNEAAQWNIQYGANLYEGRYRMVRVSPNATYSNLGFGKPMGWGLGTSVQQAIVAAGGSGYTITATGASTGTVGISSSAAGGTAATANLTLSGGVITGAQITYAGANMTSVPTFTLSSVLSSGSGGSVLARQFQSPNFVSSYDSSSVFESSTPSLVRGVCLTSALTAALISGGAWIAIQESGIASVLLTSDSAVSAGGTVSAVSGGDISAATVGTTYPEGYFGNLLDAATATTSQIARAVLNIPLQQG